MKISKRSTAASMGGFTRTLLSRYRARHRCSALVQKLPGCRAQPTVVPAYSSELPNLTVNGLQATVSSSLFAPYHRAPRRKQPLGNPASQSTPSMSAKRRAFARILTLVMRAPPSRSDRLDLQRLDRRMNRDAIQQRLTHRWSRSGNRCRSVLSESLVAMYGVRVLRAVRRVAGEVVRLFNRSFVSTKRAGPKDHVYVAEVTGGGVIRGPRLFFGDRFGHPPELCHQSLPGVLPGAPLCPDRHRDVAITSPTARPETSTYHRGFPSLGDRDAPCSSIRA